MRRALFIVILTAPCLRPLYADKWAPPTEADYFSTNRKFVAHVTPAKDRAKPKIDVLRLEDNLRVALWSSVLTNEGAPQQVFLSDDGKYAVTLNEVNDRVHGGLGDSVLAFYGKDGLIKNYSLEQILHYPDRIDQKQFQSLFWRSKSGRSWTNEPIVLETCHGKLYFRLWLSRGRRWLAWRVPTGREVEITDTLLKQWNKTTRTWALKQIAESSPLSSFAYQFLRNLKNPKDRPLIEKLLCDQNFIRVSMSRSLKTAPDGKRVTHLKKWTAASQNRFLAEQILAEWDGRPVTSSLVGQPLTYLGRIEGLVKLPRTDRPNAAALWILLLPESAPENRWPENPPAQHLFASFADYSLRGSDLRHTEQFPFAISTITPGRYRIKTLLDKTAPPPRIDNKTCKPQPGDFQPAQSVVITVEPGKTIANIEIDCTRPVPNPDQ